MAKKWWEIPAVSLFILALAILSTYPLLLHFDTGLPYAPFGGPKAWNRSGDQMQLLYWFWLVKENFMGAVPFDSNPFEFNMPVPHETSGLNTIPLAFLYMLFSPFGDIAAYNCTILSSYVLSGVFMYLLVRLYTGSRAGALLAAIIFTFAPSRMIGLTAGHAYGLLFFCYPFILFFLEKGIQAEKIRYGLVSSICLICLAMVEPHLIYYICVFLGVFIPVRIIAIFPVHRDTLSSKQTSSRSVFSWSPFRSFFIILCAGVAVVFYVQLLFAYRDHEQLVNPFFWWVLGVYPIIPVLLSLCFTAVYQRLSSLNFRESLAVEAASQLPLFLFILLSVLLRWYKPVATGVLLTATLLTVLGVKLWLLRHILLSMMKVLATSIWEEKKKIWPVLPLIFSMGGIVYWIASSKVEKIASTIADGGRTLRDVGLYSAHLSDLFVSTSSVYIGIVPAVLVGGFLLTLLWSVVLGRQDEKFGAESDFLSLFYVIVAFSCLVLALGLAFGKSSLYILFYHYFPFFNYPRVSDRIITLVLFALAIVVGFVVQHIQRRCRRQLSLGVVTVLVFAAIGLQLKDFAVFKPMGIVILDKGQDIYTYVKENVGDGMLLEIPLWPGDSHQSSLYQHYIMLDRVKRVNGCSPLVLKEYIDTVFDPLASINRGELDRKQYEILLQMGVKFITVHDNRDVFLEKVSPFVPLTTVRRLKNSPFLEFVDIDNTMYFKTFEKKNNSLYLFRLKDKARVNEEKDQSAWYEMPYFYDANLRLFHQTGELVEDKRIGKKVFQATADKHKPGFLVYGPYDIYSPGDYRVYFTVYTDADTEDNVARLEVTSIAGNGEAIVFAEKELPGNDESGLYRKFYLDFSIPQNTKLEFRVFYYGAGQVRVEKIVVNKAGHDGPIYFLEAEKMVGDTGQLVLEAEASNGKVIEVEAGKSIQGNMIYGPNRIFLTGRYNARFFLRMKNGQQVPAKDSVAVLSVTDGQQIIVYSKRNVTAQELSSGGFTGFDLDFELHRDEELSFQVYYTGKASLQLDGIEIIRR